MEMIAESQAYHLKQEALEMIGQKISKELPYHGICGQAVLLIPLAFNEIAQIRKALDAGRGE